MTYTGLTDICVHMNEYKISDVYGEGIYRMRMSIYYEKPYQYIQDDGQYYTDDSKIVKYNAIPYNIHKNPHSQMNDTTGLSIMGEYVYTDKMHMYSTYNTCRINNMCIYRFDLSSYPTIFNNNIILQIDQIVMIDTVGVYDIEQ